MSSNKYKNIDDYIAEFPSNIAQILNEIRQVIQQSAPQAMEAISYNMPAFKMNKKVLVYFAAYKNHIGFYALPSGNNAFQQDLKKYKTGKGSIQFPLEEKMPVELIQKIIKFRLKEVTDKN